LQNIGTVKANTTCTFPVDEEKVRVSVLNSDHELSVVVVNVDVGPAVKKTPVVLGPVTHASRFPALFETGM
jgi:hypothetical protein